MQAFFEKSYNRNHHGHDFACQDIRCEDISCDTIACNSITVSNPFQDIECDSLVVDNNIECNSIAADGAVVVGGLLTAKNISCNASGTDGNATVKKVITSSPITEVGGLFLGANDKVGLPSAYTSLPVAGQLGYILSASLNSTIAALTDVTVSGWTCKEVNPSNQTLYELTLTPGIWIVTCHLQLRNGTGSNGMYTLANGTQYAIMSRPTSVVIDSTSGVNGNASTPVTGESVYRLIGCTAGPTFSTDITCSTTFFAYVSEDTKYRVVYYAAPFNIWNYIAPDLSMFRAMRIG